MGAPDVVVLDGGLATELEHRGADLSGGLWSARLLLTDPAAVVAVHAAYLEAGARVLTTASYQASAEGFERAGLDAAAAAAAIDRSVALAREAVDRVRPVGTVLVAGSVGPYGAMLADGSEYTGDYARPGWTGRAGGGLGVGELRRFHRPRLERLAAAGADLIACETVPCLAEAEALVAELQRLGRPGWLSLSTRPGPDGEPLTRLGEPAGQAFALARRVPEVIAVGVNCLPPDEVAAAVRRAVAASGRPAVAYPNSGEGWDAAARRWTPGPGPEPAAAGGPEDPLVTAARGWVADGARLVGGCCRVGPDRIAALATAFGTG